MVALVDETSGITDGEFGENSEAGYSSRKKRSILLALPRLHDEDVELTGAAQGCKVLV